MRSVVDSVCARIIASVLAFSCLFVFSTNIQAQSNEKNASNHYNPVDAITSFVAPNAKEDISKRTRDSKQFIISPGHYQAVMPAGGSLHYKLNGKWIDIDNSVIANTNSSYPAYAYQNETNSFKTYYSGSSKGKGVLTVLKEGLLKDWINPSVSYIGKNGLISNQAIANVSGSAAENHMLYQNVLPGVDAEFFQNTDSRKFVYNINNASFVNNIPSGTQSVAFNESIELDPSWTVKTSDKNIDVYDAAGNWLVNMPLPMLYDQSETDPAEAQYTSTRNGNTLNISILVPSSWLKDPARVYPLVIDPTVNIYVSYGTYWTGYSVYYGSKYSGTMYQSSTTYYSRDFAKFSLTSLPSTAVVTSSTFHSYHYSGGYSYSKPVSLTRLTYDPVIYSGSVLYSSIGSSVVYNASYEWVGTYGYKTGVLNATANTDIQSRITSPGWFAIGARNDGSGYTSYGYHYAYYYSNKPYLTVSYVIPFVNDVGISAITSPNSGCLLGASETVTVTINNYGTAAQTGFNVQYVVTGPIPSTITENVGTLSIPGLGSANYTFTTNADLSTQGTYSFTAQTMLSGDQDNTNNSFTKTVNNTAAVVADAGLDKTPCAGTPVTIGGAPTGSGGDGGPYTYSWSPTTGLSSSTVANPSASVTTTTTYTVTVTDGNGCSASDVIVVTPIPLPTADAGLDQAICFDGSTQVIGGAPTASGGGGAPYTYAWSPTTDLNDPTLANPTVIPTSDGVTNYTVTITDNNGCSNTDAMQMTVWPLPNPKLFLLGNGDSICYGDTLALTTNLSGSLTTTFSNNNAFAGNMFDITTFSNQLTISGWDINVSGGTGTAYVYWRNGTYQGNTNSAAGWNLLGSATVTAAGSGLPTFVPVGGLTIPANTTYGIYVAVNYPAMTMQYTNGNLTVQNSDMKIDAGVGKGTPLFTGFTFSPRHWNGTVYYSSAIAGVHTWSTGETGTDHITVRPITDSLFWVEVVDANGCSNRDSVNIHVNPRINLNVDGDPICSGSSIVLGGSPTAVGGSDPLKYTWNPSNSLDDQHIPNPTASPVLTTNYFLSVKDSALCEVTDSVIVIVNNVPHVTASIDTGICLNDSYQLNANGTTNSDAVFFYNFNDATMQGWTTGKEDTTSLGYTSIPSTWSVSDVSGGSQPQPFASNAFGTPNNGDMGPENSWIQSPALDINGHISIQFRSFTANEDGYPSSYDVEWVEISTDGGATWNAIRGHIPALQDYYADEQWRTITVDTTVAASQAILIRFRYDTGDDCCGDTSIVGWFVDNIYISGSNKGSYSWSPASGLNDPSISNPIATPSTSTTYTVTYTDMNGCEDQEPVYVVVYPLPDPTITAAAGYCINGGPVTLTAATAGGTWSGTGITDPVNGVFDPAVAGIGVHNISYTVSSIFGCTDVDNVNIEVFALTPVSITSGNSFCTNGGIATLTASVAGGSWTGSGITNASAGTFDPTVAGLGTHMIVYAISDGNGCDNADTMMVTVNPPPDASITPAGPLCDNASSITLTAATSGGSWSGTGITNASAGTFDPSIAGAGVHTITYTVTDGNNCTDLATTTIEVFASPVVSVSAAGPFCANDAPVAMSATPTGGTWSGPGITNPTTGMFDPAFAGPGVYTITYTVTNGNGCTGSNNVQVTVNEVPDPTITPAGPFCANDVATNLSAASAGGTWSGTGITNASAGTFDPVTAGAGVHTITYSVTNNSGCTDQDQIDITVYTPVVINGSVVDVSCSGGANGEINLSVSGGTNPYTYNWSNGETAAHITGLTTGNYDVTVTDVNGCSEVSNFTVNGNPPITETHVITPPTAPSWQNGAIDLTPAGGVAPYDFIWSNGATTEDISGIGPDTFRVTIIDAAGCRATFWIIVNATFGLGIDLETLNANIGMYPNPSSGMVHIEMNIGMSTDMNWSIYDAIGRKVFERADRVNGSWSYDLDMGDMASGQYMVRFNIGDYVISRKLIISK